MPHTIQSALQKQRARAAQREAETALRQSDERYSIATQAAQVGIWDYSIESEDLFLDPIMRSMLWIADKDHGHDLGALMNLVFEKDRDRKRLGFTEFLTSADQEFSTELNIQNSAGEIRWMLVHGKKTSDSDTGGVRVVGTQMDISARKFGMVHNGQKIS